MPSFACPFCPVCNKRWSAARNALIVGFVALALSIAALRIVDDPLELVPLAIVATIAFVILAFAYLRPRMVQAGKIDENVVELKGCHPGAAQEIAEGSS